ncbi:MAG: UvrD-helicase domain-containing protein [Candidatus Komeilibacteria bacterium]|nr:UvrD-helicase domain-containing protein [Candidatus Komeilibacteria bacterium]
MTERHLINENGQPFGNQELDALGKALDSLKPAERKAFRDANAAAIASHPADQILIVAGPGTGKSTLFKQRILFWLAQDSSARILALSFVRKLVADLHADIQTDTTLTDEQKRQADVFTLHKYARSVVEQNHGTNEWRFAPHFRIIAQDWKLMVWRDVLLLSGQGDFERYSWKEFEKQLHNDDFDQSAEWTDLKSTYFRLCQFYNAAGFGDLILRAREALVENPTLNGHQCFIFDEYQDFNASEENLLEEITQPSVGTLIVGDDDQVLYETLKSGRASLIRAIYADTDVANAMLPFCGRCDFHITCAASHFIKQSAEPECISKIYLPMSEAGASQKVQVVGCSAPTTAVDYIRKFIEDHKEDIDKRKADLAAGRAKDAYLLILSPSRAVDFYKPHDAKDELFKLIAPYRVERREFCDDYYKVLNYYSLANYPANNFTFRKVLHYEKGGKDEFLALLKTCTSERKPFSTVDDKNIQAALEKAKHVRDILESQAPIGEKVEALATQIQIESLKLFRQDLEKDAINKERAAAIEHQEEEAAELEEIEVKQMSAVELLTIVGSKGLSADHVIIIGFDNVNMGWVTRNAFYVAMTRARKSLHIITGLKAGGSVRPHKFLDQLPDANLDFSRYAKGERKQTAFGSRNEFLGYLQYLNTQHRRRK